MKYDQETTNHLVTKYNSGMSVKELSELLDVPERSIIAKLSTLGIYKKKGYLNKRGETPVKKEEYLERIAKKLDVDITLVESLIKANKNVLALIENRLVLSPQADSGRKTDS